MLAPQEVFDEIRKVVVGQDNALREISVALVKHLLGHPAGNILLIGNSGSGKTTLMKAVEDFLSSRNDLARYSTVIRINANVLAEEREGSGSSVLGRLHRQARKGLPGGSVEELIQRMERGIVFIDEIDKIRASVAGAANVKGIVAQEALLTLMENEHLEYEVEDPLPQTIAINSSSILFVAGGAFEELYDSVHRRATVGSDVAPLKSVVVVSQTGEVREEMSFHLRDYLRYDDLFRYGMTPQFVSRFESIIVLDDLTERDLARIFIEPPNSVFRVSRDYFQRFGVDLQISKGAVQAIAWEASRQNRLGARALKEIYRKVIRNLEFDPKSGLSAESGVIVLNEEMVKQAVRNTQQGTREHG